MLWGGAVSLIYIYNTIEKFIQKQIQLLASQVHDCVNCPTMIITCKYPWSHDDSFLMTPLYILLTGTIKLVILFITIIITLATSNYLKQYDASHSLLQQTYNTSHYLTQYTCASQSTHCSYYTSIQIQASLWLCVNTDILFLSIFFISLFISAKFCGAFFSNTIRAKTLKFGMCISFGIVKMLKIMQIRAIQMIESVISSRILLVVTQMLVLCICLLGLCIYWTHYQNCRI